MLFRPCPDNTISTEIVIDRSLSPKYRIEIYILTSYLEQRCQVFGLFVSPHMSGKDALFGLSLSCSQDRSVHDGVKKEKNLVKDINFCMKYVIMTPDEKERLAIQEFKANEGEAAKILYVKSAHSYSAKG
ncbi:hypothetical protein ABG067_006353 [Albugo candida]